MVLGGMPEVVFTFIKQKNYSGTLKIQKQLLLDYEEDITYAEFEELRFAIETLGGEYDKKRDFSSDKTAKKIKGGKNTQIIG